MRRMRDVVSVYAYVAHTHKLRIRRVCCAFLHLALANWCARFGLPKFINQKANASYAMQ